MINNFHLLRLISAFLVFYGHSFVFLGLTEPLFYSGHSLHGLGVIIFFIMSGYLIAESWNRDPSCIRFFIKRALRFFPALIIFVLIAVFILGPCLTTLSIKEYFLHHRTYLYFSNIFLRISFFLPGVFENLKANQAVNGSLWSLPVEFFLYIMLALCGFITTSKRYIYLILFVISVILNIVWASNANIVVIYGTDLRQIFLMGVYFWAGAVFFVFNLKRYCSTPRVVMAIIILVSLPHTYSLSFFAYILLPYIVLSFALSPPLQELNWMIKPGDYSYGFYIYSFPIQQLVLLFNPDINLFLYLLICLSLTLPLAILSWKIIEQPMRSLKPKRPSLKNKD